MANAINYGPISIVRPFDTTGATRWISFLLLAICAASNSFLLEVEGFTVVGYPPSQQQSPATNLNSLAGTTVASSSVVLSSSSSPTAASDTTTTSDSASSSSSAPSASELIEAAANFMKSGQGYFSPIQEDLLADDFVFRGPVIGPLNKRDYVDVLDYFSVYRAFPDIQANCFGFTVDPDDPHRVWFLVRASGTYRAPLGGALGELAARVTPPDGRRYQGSTETWSLTFNNQKQVRYISAGYVSDRFEQEATTRGKGLTFGVLSSIGLSLPSGVNSPGLQLTQTVTQAVQGTGLFPRAFSDAGQVPEWWKSDKFGAE